MIEVDLIVTEPLSPSTGFQFTQSNIGQIGNKDMKQIGIDFSEILMWVFL
jgi:hypothetical protein